jgi:hypothetical protein
MIRIASIITVLVLVAISTVNAVRGERSHHRPAFHPRAFGAGSILSFEETHVERARAIERTANRRGP